MKIPDVLYLITDKVVEQIAKDKLGLSDDEYDINKTWEEMGADELDCVELVMCIEKELNIIITDEVFEIYFRETSKPCMIPGFKINMRNDKIDKLIE